MIIYTRTELLTPIMTVGGYPSLRLNRNTFLSMMCCDEYNAHSSRKVAASGGRLHGGEIEYNNLFIFEGAIRPFTRSYFFGLTQKVTKKVKASSSPFLLVQEFFSFAVLRPVRRSPYLSLRRSFRSFRPGSPASSCTARICSDVWPGVCFV